jgi:hypothetical protein
MPLKYRPTKRLPSLQRAHRNAACWPRFKIEPPGCGRNLDLLTINPQKYTVEFKEQAIK